MPQLFVRTLDGSTLCLAREGTVQELKRTVEEREGENFGLFLVLLAIFFHLEISMCT
jgi:hypothetical protein